MLENTTNIHNPIIVWGNYDDYTSAVEQPAYIAAIDSLKPLLDGTLKDIESVFVDFTTTPEEALAAPVSEIVITELKPGETEKDVIILDDVIAASGVTLGNHWGHVHGKSDEYGLFVGWESVQASPYRKIYLKIACLTDGFPFISRMLRLLARDFWPRSSRRAKRL